MKRIFLSISLFGLLLGTQSCNNDYLETTPTDMISAKSIVETADNMMLSINGMHRSMYARQVSGSTASNGYTGMMIVNDAMGDDMIFPNIGTGQFIVSVRWTGHRTETSAYVSYPWNFYYKLIRNANIIINGGAGASGSETTKNNAIGQAYAFRAFSHYQLVQLFAKRYDKNTPDPDGIPLRLEVSDDPISRSSVEEVYAQINKDLDKAEEYLSKAGTRVHKSHFNVNVVRGLKARVALTMGDYDTAAAQAKLARTGFPLMNNTTYKAGFNQLSNTEWMWGCEIIADQTDYFGNFGAFIARNATSTNARKAPKIVSKSLYKKFPTTDVRTQVIDSTGVHTSLKLASTYDKYPYTSQKFLSVSGDSYGRMDVPFMRAAEMYLIEAEALARNGREAEAKTIFTTFSKNRNPSYTTSTATGDAFITEILDSRRLELWGEGFRFFDLKRLNQPLVRNTTEHFSNIILKATEIPAGDVRWQFLIPRRELDANTLLKQNP